LPGDDPEEVEEAISAVKRLRLLRHLREQAQTSSVPAVLFHLDREISHLQRGLRPKTGVDRKANHVLRRALDEVAAAEAAKMREKRAAAFETRRLKAQVAAAKAKAKAIDEEKKRLAAVTKAKLAAVPLEFSIAAVGPDTKAAFQQRVLCLDRLKLRSPALVPEAEVNWPRVRDHFARWVVIAWKAGCGKFFLDRVNSCLRALGSHYSGPTPWNRKGEPGDAEAFNVFYREMARKLPKPSTAVYV
jgi:hypothetical protein